MRSRARRAFRSPRDGSPGRFPSTIPLTEPLDDRLEEARTDGEIKNDISAIAQRLFQLVEHVIAFELAGHVLQAIRDPVPRPVVEFEGMKAPALSAAKLFSDSVNWSRQALVSSWPWFTPMIFILSSSRRSDDRLYSAGISSRLVRSPAAPKMTSVHGGAGACRQVSGRRLCSEWGRHRVF